VYPPDLPGGEPASDRGPLSLRNLRRRSRAAGGRANYRGVERRASARTPREERMSLIDELLEDDDGDLREASVCPVCRKATETSPCERCAAKLRFKPVGAVLGEGILDDLELSEADLAEAVDRPSGGGEAHRGPDRRLVKWAAVLRDYGHSPERVAEIINGSGFAAGEVDRALRLVDARTAAIDDDEDDPLSEGLDGWLDDRIEG
jgi:hypothetical protein